MANRYSLANTRRRIANTSHRLKVKSDLSFFVKIRYQHITVAKSNGDLLACIIKQGTLIKQQKHVYGLLEALICLKRSLVNREMDLRLRCFYDRVIQ